MSSWAVTSHAYATHTLARSPIVYYGSPFQAAADGGFRPGMPRLRDLKNNWTLTDFFDGRRGGHRVRIGWEGLSKAPFMHLLRCPFAENLERAPGWSLAHDDRHRHGGVVEFEAPDNGQLLVHPETDLGLATPLPFVEVPAASLEHLHFHLTSDQLVPQPRDAMAGAQRRVHVVGHDVGVKRLHFAIAHLRAGELARTGNELNSEKVEAFLCQCSGLVEAGDSNFAADGCTGEAVTSVSDVSGTAGDTSRKHKYSTDSEDITHLFASD